jgi:hypothetical protein
VGFFQAVFYFYCGVVWWRVLSSQKALDHIAVGLVAPPGRTFRASMPLRPGENPPRRRAG